MEDLFYTLGVGYLLVALAPYVIGAITFIFGVIAWVSLYSEVTKYEPAPYIGETKESIEKLNLIRNKAILYKKILREKQVAYIGDNHLHYSKRVLKVNGEIVNGDLYDSLIKILKEKYL